MQITDKMREFWKKHQERGDITAIAKEADCTPATIQRIIEAKEPYKEQAPHRFVVQLQKFYNKRAKVFKSTKKLHAEID